MITKTGGWASLVSDPKWKTIPREGEPTNLYEVTYRCRGKVERVIGWSEPELWSGGAVLTERNRCVFDYNHVGDCDDGFGPGGQNEIRS